MTENLLQEALSRYNLSDAAAEFIRHNENITYKVLMGDNAYLLRIHVPREGFSLGILGISEGEKFEFISGEMTLLSHLHKSGFAAQMPVRNAEMDYVTRLSDGSCATLLEWIPGADLDGLPMTCDMAYELGEMAARLHIALDDLGNMVAHRRTVLDSFAQKRELSPAPPGDLNDTGKRCQNACDNLAQGIVSPRTSLYSYGELPIRRISYTLPLMDEIKSAIRLAASSGHFDRNAERAALMAADAVRDVMRLMYGQEGSMGYCHADLCLSNVLRTDRGLVPIDFSLSGWGYRMMDLGGLAAQLNTPEHTAQMIRGYERMREIKTDIRAIEAFYALSILLFIACQSGRYCGEDWFGAAMKRWSEECFLPLSYGDRFLMG